MFFYRYPFFPIHQQEVWKRQSYYETIPLLIVACIHMIRKENISLYENMKNLPWTGYLNWQWAFQSCAQLELRLKELFWFQKNIELKSWKSFLRNLRKIISFLIYHYNFYNQKIKANYIGFIYLYFNTVVVIDT